MTEKIKSAISIIENEKECVQSDCNRDCSRCELVKEESEIVSAFDTAIRSLQSWEEVLQELENEKNKSYENGGFNYSGLQRAISIINQKLAEIEE